MRACGGSNWVATPILCKSSLCGAAPSDMPKQWTCRACGKRNLWGKSQCYHCGYNFEAHSEEWVKQYQPSSPSDPRRSATTAELRGKYIAWWKDYQEREWQQPPSAGGAWRWNRKADRDALAASSLINATPAQSEAGDLNPEQLRAASRHFAKTAKEMSFCPEAQEALQKKSGDLKALAFGKLDIKEQIKVLEQQLNSKVQESQRLETLISSSKDKLKIVQVDGCDLEVKLKSLKEVRDRAPPTPPPAPGSTLDSLSKVGSLSGFLGPEMEGPFHQIIALLTNMVQQAEGASGQAAAPIPVPPSPPAAVVDPYERSAPPIPPCFNTPPRTSVASAARNSANAFRGRQRPRSPEAEADADGFIPTCGRSRSVPGRRLRKKTNVEEESVAEDVSMQADMDQVLIEGSRYFSSRSERAGLDL